MTDATIECRGCGTRLRATARFCDACGSARHPIVGNSISTGGGGFSSRDVYQAGGDIHFGVARDDSAQGTMPDVEVKPLWNSPVTQGALAWVSVGLGLLGLLAGWQSVASVIDGVFGASTSGLFGGPSIWWIYAFLGLMLLFSLALSLHRITRRRALALSGFSMLPGLTGWGGRISIVRLKGRCRCGGRLRFHNRGAGRSGGYTRDLRVTCTNVPEEHQWSIDPSAKVGS